MEQVVHAGEVIGHGPKLRPRPSRRAARTARVIGAGAVSAAAECSPSSSPSATPPSSPAQRSSAFSSPSSVSTTRWLSPRCSAPGSSVSRPPGRRTTPTFHQLIEPVWRRSASKGRRHSHDFGGRCRRTTALRLFAAAAGRCPMKGSGPAGNPEVTAMDPEANLAEVGFSGEADAGEMAGQHSASERSAEEHDLQEGLAGLSRLATNQLGLEDLLTRVATYAVKAIPGADGAGLTLLEADRADTIVATADVRERDRRHPVRHRAGTLYHRRPGRADGDLGVSGLGPAMAEVRRRGRPGSGCTVRCRCR